MKSLKPGAILKSQGDKDKTIMLISLLLMKVASLYQIPNWGEHQSIILSDWVYLNYQYDKLESVIKVLSNPPVDNDRNWRLTPDTIQVWMAIELERESAKREKEIYNAKQNHPLNDVDLLLTEALANDKGDEPKQHTRNQEIGKKLVPLTRDEIELMGQGKPYKKPYHSELNDQALHTANMKSKYGRECTDLITGKILPGALSFDEWILIEGEQTTGL